MEVPLGVAVAVAREGLAEEGAVEGAHQGHAAVRVGAGRHARQGHRRRHVHQSGIDGVEGRRKAEVAIRVPHDQIDGAAVGVGQAAHQVAQVDAVGGEPVGVHLAVAVAVVLGEDAVGGGQHPTGVQHRARAGRAAVVGQHDHAAPGRVGVRQWRSVNDGGRALLDVLPGWHVTGGESQQRHGGSGQKRTVSHEPSSDTHPRGVASPTLTGPRVRKGAGRNAFRTRAARPPLHHVGARPARSAPRASLLAF